MKSQLIHKYAANVPRYTSYPTAPHFSDAVDGATYREWLGQLDPAQELSLYFHIPFCAEMCWFCGCHTKITRQYAPISDYIDTLMAEVDLVADALPAKMTARHIHWGGGSPSMLEEQDWLKVLDHLRSRFHTDSATKIAIELDPRTTRESYIAALATAGVNRVSIGVQDFHPEVQEAIHRIQPYDVTKRVVDQLRAHGIKDINVDLMYGLPHQTVERVKKSVDLAVDLDPTRLSLFGYAHVPWMKSHQKMIKDSTLPDPFDRALQFEAASRRLQMWDFLPIGLDHFARPDDDLTIAMQKGELRRNFQGYTTDTAAVLLGFGASSIGKVPQGYIQNQSPLKTYRDQVKNGHLATTKGIAFSAEDRLRGDVIERLMCDSRVDLADIAKRHETDVSVFYDDLDALTPMAEDLLVYVDGTHVRVTDKGKPFLRTIAATFDSYLKKGTARHSVAV
ncbi:MAG: oxygen-independent coproporphyrinogen III oxidase [Rhodospirillaceae bacterium]|nr:oxygen-independent coproporphyrinogen III oxidase [Rhodospirillales bacterium]MBT3906038.1 oxygen-independent coproporphyrinogen III oxidase [Rhodospirillaceae bacterium]MBT4699926.1 oxygen-independent coproporphyrinogen III oxidase [Rhodospirillaceae bacterium]MBT5036057.1 oxygen-independent coproporphyrinogen III oxidase [Rhodospirillaceae bacterium]MBT6220559.1 oxygen-independent coproporphyrinogen III oxidase [Rhodospirillaceae bacterium]